jgi:hypothetical protein
MHGAWGHSWGHAWGYAWGRRRRSLEGGEIYLKRRRYFVRKNGKIHLFDNAQEADAFNAAIHHAEVEARTKTSRLARKRVRDAVIAKFTPEIVDIKLTQLLAEKYELPNILQFIDLQDWDKVLQIQALAIEMEEEEDVALLISLP